MTHRFRIAAALLTAVFCAAVAADEPVVPERFNQGPRVLFNTRDTDKLDEIIPGQFYQRYWHGVRATIQHGRLVKSAAGHAKTVPGYHGEEVLVVLEGRLRFTFPDSGRSHEIGPGDVFHFPNILHHGVCLTAECRFIGIYMPNRPDFGPEGSKMTIDTNQAFSR